MSVLINKKRCDNRDICPCIEECPTRAFYYDDIKKSVAVDNNLCIYCKQCIIACEAGAVKVATNDEEYNKIKNEYECDLMSVEELFQDRYGASIVDDKYSLDIEDLEQLLKDSNKHLLIDFFNDDDSSCLVNSIPINEIMKKINVPVSYRKINVTDINEVSKYGINELPSLLIYNNGEEVFKHEGFVYFFEKDKLLKELSENKF